MKTGRFSICKKDHVYKPGIPLIRATITAVI